MRKRILPVLLALLTGLMFSSCAPEEPVMPDRINPTTERTKPSVGENYYGYINFEYLTTAQVPYGKSSFGTLDYVREEMQEYVEGMIDRVVADKTSTDPIENTVREMYLQYMDVEAREKAGIQVLMPMVGMIDACQTPDELVKALGVMSQEYGTDSFFRFVVAPDFCQTSVNRLMLRLMNTCGSMKENFTRRDAGSEQIGKLCEQMLTAMNVENDEAHARAVSVVAMINDIMRATKDSSFLLDVESNNNHYTPAELPQLFSHINTDELLAAFGYSVSDMVVYDEKQCEKINEYFTKEHLQELKDYSLTCLMYEYQDSLPESYLEASNQNITEEDRVKNAKIWLGNVLEYEIGVLYGREICTDEVMTAVNNMLDSIRNSCRDLIGKCARLTEEDKTKHLKKLENMMFLVGYDRNYQSSFTVVSQKDGGSVLMNLVAEKRGEKQRNLDRINRKVDRTSWDMSAIEVNAVYNRSGNRVTIPAVMLSPAMFDLSASLYHNLGMLGYVIAHEMNHSFDADGFCYDENGNYSPDWMSESGEKAFSEILERTKTYYQNYQLLDLYNIDGAQTLAENTADLGAVQCLVNISSDKKNLTELFEGVACQWATLMTVSDVMVRLEGDEHSVAEARVNAVVASMDAFYEVYDIRETDKMYVAPDNRIKVW